MSETWLADHPADCVRSSTNALLLLPSWNTASTTRKRRNAGAQRAGLLARACAARAERAGRRARTAAAPAPRAPRGSPRRRTRAGTPGPPARCQRASSHQREQRADRGAGRVHGAVQPERAAAVGGGRGIGDERVARRRAQPLAEAVRAAQRQHRGPRRGQPDRRLRRARERVARDHEAACDFPCGPRASPTWCAAATRRTRRAPRSRPRLVAEAPSVTVMKSGRIGTSISVETSVRSDVNPSATTLGGFPPADRAGLGAKHRGSCGGGR